MRTIDLFPIPIRYQDVTYADVLPTLKANDPEAMTAALDWVTRFPEYLKGRTAGGGVIFYGPPGAGKSMLAAAMLNRIVELSNGGAWISDDSLDVMLKDFRARRFRTEDEEDLMDRLVRVAHCVVVDDALHWGGSDEYLQPFLRARSDNGRPTILTINNEVVLSDSMASYLSNWTTVTFSGRDLRRYPHTLS
jgi:hypothetical protein